MESGLHTHEWSFSILVKHIEAYMHVNVCAVGHKHTSQFPTQADHELNELIGHIWPHAMA